MGQSGSRLQYAEKARPFAAVYLQTGIDKGLSAATLSTRRAALCKLYGCNADDIGIRLPPRERGAITRSRYSAARDADFSETANAGIITFARATGLRRHELAAVKPMQIQRRGGKLRIINVTGKGGKTRDVDVLPGAYDAVLRYASLPENGRIFRVPSHMDVHACRREYTQAFYRQIARDVKQLGRSERYICRYDKAGVVYDRAAMLVVSRQLGHNRISVIAGHYL